MLLFPEFTGKQFGSINMQKEAQAWLRRKRIPRSADNPFLKPNVCQEMVDEFHDRLGLAWSYGGWLEDRKNLWRGTYLEELRKYLHVGVDLNVSVGAEVAAPFSAEVMRVDQDFDNDGGWGGRVILDPHEKFGQDCVFILAHLSNQIAVKVGDLLRPGQGIGTIGSTEENGGWYSHLHVQAVDRRYYERLLAGDLADLDGYVGAEKRQKVSLVFPDPLFAIGIR